MWKWNINVEGADYSGVGGSSQLEGYSQISVTLLHKTPGDIWTWTRTKRARTQFLKEQSVVAKTKG